MSASSRWAAAYAVLAALAVFGLFANLDDRLLWADEAETALLASNITEFGWPLADDGKNDLGRTRPGSRSEHALWIWSPWLDEYVAAGSFLVLGRSTLSARLPFAAIALLSVLLLARIAWRASRSHEFVATALLLYVTCVPMLLHARQARYYAILLFAQLWLLYGVQRAMRSTWPRSSLHVAGALSAIFYCNYIVLPGNVIGLGVAALLLRKRHPALLRSVGVGGIAALALALPWLVYARPGGQAALLGVAKLPSHLVYYLGEIHYHIVSLGLLALPLLGLAIERWWPGAAARVPAEARRLWEKQAGRDLRVVIVSLAGAQLLFLGFAPDRFFRYLTPMIPLLLLLLAYLLMRFVPWRSLRLVVLGVLVASNLMSTAMALPFPKQHRTAFSYPTFLRSISNSYEDRLEAVLDRFGADFAPEHSAFVDDHELPLIFYTDMRIVEARRAERIWRESSDQHPDWVFPSAPSALLDRHELRFRPGPSYEPLSVEVPRSRRGGSRPHPDVYEFFTAEERERFELYRKRVRNSQPPGS